MSEEKNPQLKWFEVTWTITEGVSHVKAESEAEARKLASDHADLADQGGPMLLAGGRIVAHEWYDPTDQEPYISEVEEDDSGKGPDIEAGMERK